MNESVEQVRSILAELIKAALISDDEMSFECRRTAARGQQALADDPPEPDSVKIDGAWMLAIQDAEKPELRSKEGQVSLTFPRESVIALSELVAHDFDIDDAVKRIRESASTG